MAAAHKTTEQLEVGRAKRVANLTNAGKGRPKGVPNKSTIAVKQALQDAFDTIGGVARLAKYAEAEPGEFYKLWVKVLPLEIAGADGGAITVQILTLAASK